MWSYIVNLDESLNEEDREQASFLGQGSAITPYHVRGCDCQVS
jgi:hypothetical protein